MGNDVPWSHPLGRHRYVFKTKRMEQKLNASSIALGYSLIAPIMNGFACATFFLFYQLYKYLFLYVYQQPTTTDTGGLFYPKAFQHVLTGMYVQQICLCALFFLAVDSNGHHSSVAEGALMVVLIVITVSFWNFFFFRSMLNLARPVSILSSTTRMDHSSKLYH